MVSLLVASLAAVLPVSRERLDGNRAVNPEEVECPVALVGIAIFTRGEAGVVLDDAAMRDTPPAATDVVPAEYDVLDWQPVHNQTTRGSHRDCCA